MATLARVMDELAAVISDVLNGEDIQVEGRMVLNPSGPCVDIYPGEPSTDPEFAGMGEVLGDGEMLNVRARVGTADDYAGQDLLLALMDDEDDLSIANAIQDDPTLNGVASSIDIKSRSGYTLFPDPSGGGAWLGCLFTVEVVKARS